MMLTAPPAALAVSSSLSFKSPLWFVRWTFYFEVEEVSLFLLTGFLQEILSIDPTVQFQFASVKKNCVMHFCFSPHLSVGH